MNEVKVNKIIQSFDLSFQENHKKRFLLTDYQCTNLYFFQKTRVVCSKSIFIFLNSNQMGKYYFVTINSHLFNHNLLNAISSNVKFEWSENPISLPFKNALSE